MEFYKLKEGEEATIRFLPDDCPCCVAGNKAKEKTYFHMLAEGEIKIVSLPKDVSDEIVRLHKAFKPSWWERLIAWGKEKLGL